MSEHMEWWEERYAEFLDEVYPKGVEVAGYTFDVSRALYELDPTAFRMGANDYADGEGWDLDRDEDDQDTEEEEEDA